MTKKILIAGCLLIAIVVALFVHSVQDLRMDTTEKDDQLEVITTFLPLYVFTANVAGDAAHVTNLLPPGVGPHEYSFTPADVRRIADADVIVMNGKKLEAWMDQLIAQSGTHAQIIDASADVPALDDNPHVWLDPVRAQTMVQTIAIGLTRTDSDIVDGQTYMKNASNYIARLTALDAEYHTTLSSLPHKDFIAFHSAFAYLAARYGLRERAVIEEFPGKEPTARYLAEVVDIIKKEKVKAIFSEPQFSPKVVQTVADETGLTVRELDTAETGAFSTETYEIIMKKNLKTLQQALQ